MTDELIDKYRMADLMEVGLAARARVEDALDDHLEQYGLATLGIGFDAYDNSLEVYMTETTGSDWGATEKEWGLIKSFGFSRAWFNFSDGTEQYLSWQAVVEDVEHKPWIGKRAAQQHPHWRDKRKCSNCGATHYQLLAEIRDLKTRLAK